MAWAASIAGVLLAVLPALGGRSSYDPGLAVLTATLIAVIWYTYLTYRVVNNEPPTTLDFGLGYQKSVPSLGIQVSNGGRLHVTVVPRVSIRTPTGFWPVPPPLTGVPDDAFRLRPGEGREKRVDLGGIFETIGDHARKAIVVADADWTDEAGDAGHAGPKVWLVDLERQDIVRLYSESEIDAETKGWAGDGPPAA